ncbi:unnamed protein product [Caenorhabditis bovis]|uniref:ENTH domain-containing protein n=1 Tax=Caenorhabditis bovis TaxID=2654633 RepID=A0A8S1FBG7_9PELO|nr:unnamed protein product [Caenorhabditis bovis]
MSDLFSGITSSIKSAATAISRNEHVRKITEVVNDQIMGYTEVELAVREATNEDPWGPTGPQMKQISNYLRRGSSEEYRTVFELIFNRMLQNNKDAWRRVYKSLVLLDYLLKNGSERFVSDARDKSYEIRRLESYKYIDEKGKDQGINIRHRAKLVLQLLNDDDLLKAERQKAMSDDKSKYRGFDKYDMINESSFRSSSSFNGSGNWSGSGTSNYDYDKKSIENKEVSNFSFDKSPNKLDVEPTKIIGDDDDDGFGDFVSSRSAHSTPSATKANTASATRVDDLFAAAIPPPIAPPPAASQPAALPRKPSLTNEVSNVDLLGGFDAPTIPTIEANRPSRPAPVDPVIDLFAQISSTPVASAPAAAPAQNNIDLFGFGAAPIAATTTPTSNFDALGSLSFTPVAPTPVITSPSLTAVPKPAPAPAQTKKVGSSFQGLDDFMNLSLGSSSNSAPKAKTLNEMRNSQK